MNTESKLVEIVYKDNRIIYQCPKCKKPLIFRKRYQGRSLCILCGQRLDWKSENDIYIEVFNTRDSDESAWIADRYYEACKTPESKRLDTDDWRKSLKGQGGEMYLLFQNGKAHGNFMRRYAKEVKNYDN